MGKLEGCLISSEQSLRRDSVTDLGTKGFKGTSSMSVVCSWLDSVFPVFQFCPLMARAVREASQRRTSTGPWLGRWVGCGGGGEWGRGSGALVGNSKNRGEDKVWGRRKHYLEGPCLERGDEGQTGTWTRQEVGLRFRVHSQSHRALPGLLNTS